VQSSSEMSTSVASRADEYGGALIASLADGACVHEVAVTALVSLHGDGDVHLRGVARCRLLSLVGDDVPLVRAQRLPDPPAQAGRQERLAVLLLTRYRRLCKALGRSPATAAWNAGLAALTWSVTAELSLNAEQQQGFLNVPDAVTRGRLLLLAMRERERRARFLRPWSHLRSAAAWN